MNANRLRELRKAGQSIWLDALRRYMLSSGEFHDMIADLGVSGVTSNPALFEKVVAGSRDYKAAVPSLMHDGKSVVEVYQALAVEDIRQACDLLLPLYEQSGGREGFATLDISPQAAHDTQGIIDGARRLWESIGRPNAMIKIAATTESIPAVQQLIADGLNLHLTRLFDVRRYQREVDAYLSGLEARHGRGQPIDHVRFVTGFFIGRIDLMVDPLLERIGRRRREKLSVVAELLGRVGIAVATLAYAAQRELVASPRFRRLAELGAGPPRLLWSSTDVKRPAHDPLMYLEALAAPDTIVVASSETLYTFAARGRAAPRLAEREQEAHAVRERLHELDLDFEEIAQQMRDESIDSFFRPFDRLSVALRLGWYTGSHRRFQDQQIFTGGEHRHLVHDRLQQLGRDRFARRLWRKDPELWHAPPSQASPVMAGMGWLNLADKMEGYLPALVEFVDEIEGAGFRHVLHFGGGGSSRIVMLLREMLASGAVGLPLSAVQSPNLPVLDELLKKVPLAKILFLIDGHEPIADTLPPAVARLFEMVQRDRGTNAGKQFVAITQPHSVLADFAEEHGFRRLFLDFAGMKEPYLALAYLGLVPAALLGVDLEEFLTRTNLMVHGCASCVPLRENNAVVLGATLGELALARRNKVTFLLPERLTPLGWWLEDLLAESVDWRGRALLPLVSQQPRPATLYRQDRVFVHIHLTNEPDEALQQAALALREAGHPLVSIPIADPLDLGQEFFRWQMAAVTAAAIMGIDPFSTENEPASVYGPPPASRHL